MRKLLKVLLLLTALLSILSISVLAADTEAAGIENSNVFETIYTQILRHSDKILSALAFASSLLLAIIYRKGLLPLMRGGLKTIGSAVANLKDETEKLSATSNENITLATEKLLAAENIVTALSEKLEALESELMLVNETQAKYADMKIIMRYQIDMLYEVFMSSSLPLYQKEAIGEKISEMKRLVSDTEEAKNE